MKKKKTKINKIEIYAIASLLVILLIVILYPYLKPRNVIWCNFEENITVGAPHNHCVYMKIITRDSDKLNLDEFFKKGVGAGCYDSYDELPECSEEEYHFTQLELSLLSDEKVDGTICIAYHTTFYYSNNTLAESEMELYRMGTFQYGFENKDDMLTKFKNCEVR